MKPPQELDEEMLEELDEFLMSEDAPEDCLQISDLDGFLTGIVVGPELIMPSEWVPCIWRGEEPNFKSADHAEHIVGIIMCRYNEIIHQLNDEPEEFWPIVHSTPDGRLLAADWIEGFMDAFGLRVDAWDDLFQDEDGRYLMGPLIALTHDKDGKSLITGTEEEQQQVRDDAAEALPVVVKGIYDFWKVRRKPHSDEEVSLGTKVGRNEPCPCGSGRKYKKCCGSN
ncbi:MAG: UPF0149 family protein [Alphaproteobacteria bacterium]|jgi:uncharacterized protein|nr:UPF0149 family protein [Alphaproteobacteria bacterium]MBT4085049.1 UPF0149 family protein [Alphaproteobacteria bacterium]MBT4545597.1 UPF0149 family protein [Alphaproteobacteria bacterium]